MRDDETVTSQVQVPSPEGSDIRLATLLDGVSETWQKNVPPILGRPMVATAKMGWGCVDAPAILLSQDQARHLATLITEILRPESRRQR